MKLYNVPECFERLNNQITEDEYNDMPNWQIFKVWYAEASKHSYPGTYGEYVVIQQNRCIPVET